MKPMFKTLAAGAARLTVQQGLALAFLVSSCSAASAADLIGDQIDILRAYPTPATPYWVPLQTITLVPAHGAADAVQWNAPNFPMTVDADATQIRFLLESGSNFEGLSSGFDGFVVTGFDHDVAQTSVLSNDTGLTLVATLAAPRELHTNLDGDNLPNSSFAIGVSLVPEPGTWALLGGGLAVLGAASRRRRACRLPTH